MVSDIIEILKKLSEEYNADVFIFSAKINDRNADELINEIRKVKNRKDNCILILTTNGGDPDAGFRIVRCINQYYKYPKKFLLYVFGFCKSTGTLIALGADEIVMGDLAEFGPLDIQLNAGDELTNTSGLSYLQSLFALNEKIYSSFEENFMSLKGYGITTKTAAEIGSKLAIGIIEPIAAQIDPLKLGEVQRAIKIASEYGERIIRTSGKDLDSVKRLIGNYPSHSFVIDFEEMKTLFKNKAIRRPTEFEYKIEEELSGVVRTESKNKIIFHAKLIEDEEEEAPNEPPEPEQAPQNSPQNAEQHEPNQTSPIVEPTNGHQPAR